MLVNIGIVRYYKPDNNGKRRFYKEEIYHKNSVFKLMTERWEKMYGKEFYEVLAA